MIRLTILLISIAYVLSFTPDCSEEDDLLADPQNCSMFYMCANGVAYPIACAEGLHFNPVTLVCDWPESAGCSLESTEPTTKKPSSICQGIQGNNTLVPDPENCGGFYACDEGREVYLQCPDSLHFNQILEACDWPETAGCVSSSNSTGLQECDALREGAFKPDDADCQRFYVCSHAVWYNFSCPNNTHFNPKLKVCDWPKYAGCQVNKAVPSLCDDVVPEFELVSDPEDCGKFYSCVNGNPVSMDCPDNLHFNYYNQTCDWPDNVGCKKEATTTELYS